MIETQAGDDAPAKRPRARRSSEREELRQEILRAVMRLHGAGGYDAVTMRSVAKEVGLSAMSLYRYFPNKAALLEHVWYEVLGDALKATYAPAKARPMTPIRRLRQLYLAYVRFWLARPQDFRFLFDPTCEVPANLTQNGPALQFRQEVESLIDRCLGAEADLQRRTLAYDLCRAKVVGYLYTSIGMETKPHSAADPLLAALLDDIERQLSS